MKSSSNTLVSVVIPAYNGQETIPRAINSVLEQTYRNHEIIVVDDGSTDSTLDVLSRYGSEITLIRQQNAGAMAARNIGAKHANGAYIAFLDQDDWWIPKKLEIQVRALEAEPSLGLVFGNLEAVDKQEKSLRFMTVLPDYRHSPSLDELLLIFPLYPSSATLRKDLFDRTGGFDTRFGSSGAYGDQDLHVRLRRLAPFRFLDMRVGYYFWDELRPGRVQNFLQNLPIFAEKYWNSRLLLDSRGRSLDERFVRKCTEHMTHILRRLLQQNGSIANRSLLLQANTCHLQLKGVFGASYLKMGGMDALNLGSLNMDEYDSEIPLSTLLFLYLCRPDLQRSFPEVFGGNLMRLTHWAVGVARGDRLDIDNKTLAPFRDYYEALPHEAPLIATKAQRNLNFQLFTASIRVIAEQGFRSYFRQAWEKIMRKEFRIIEPVPFGLPDDFFYNAWIVENSPNPSEVRDLIGAFQYQPKISIVMPVYNADPKFLKDVIESVEAQLYENWELCICDNGSTNTEVKMILLEASRSDKRVRLTTLPDRQSISGCTNAVLASADGEFTGFLDHDDKLYPDALYEVVKLINDNPELDYMYSDEDKIDLNGRRVEPFFKPDWSPDLLLSVNYVTHFSVYKTSLLRSLGGLREGYEGSQDYDLVLRATEKTHKIGHVRKVIYGWRISPTPTAGSETAKPIAYASAVKALQEAMARRGIKAQVKMLPIYRYRVKYEINGKPLVTIIIPARTTKYIGNCVRGILEKTSYNEYEILVVDNGTGMNLAKILDRSEKLRFVTDSSDFNWSRMNNRAAKVAKGEYLVFLNDDTEVISGEWLSAMLEHAQREGVGAVGSKLLLANETVQHAGIIVGTRGYATNYFGMTASEPGYFALASMIRNCTAVTGACMMVRKSYFMEMGGFDETLGHSWNDVDFCIRVVQNGRWIVYTPFALLYHYLGGTRGEHDTSSEETKAKGIFRRKNSDFLSRGDPFYNPNLSINEEYLYLPKCNRIAF